MQRFRSMKTLKKSAQFMPRSTTISVRSAISPPASVYKQSALPRSPPGSGNLAACNRRSGSARAAPNADDLPLL